MKNCSEYEELAYLDVLGEMPPERKREWETHISTCAECRALKGRLETVVRLGKEELGGATLSPFEATILGQKITSAISAKNTGFSLRKLAVWRKRILLPIAAAACLFVVSFIGFRQWWPRNSANPVVAQRAGTPPSAPIEEKEIIQNLDLLEQMDTLRALVKVVDNKEII